MTNDIGNSILFSIVIVAIIIGIIAIIITIFNIEDDNQSTITDFCERSCPSPNLRTINGPVCTRDINGNCSLFVVAESNIEGLDGISRLILSPIPKSPTSACQNFCIGDIKFDSDTTKPICTDEDCIGEDSDCAYDRCIDTLTGPDQCSGRTEPMACVENLLYYLYAYVPPGQELPESCVCNLGS